MTPAWVLRARAPLALAAGGIAALGFAPMGWRLATFAGLAALVWLCERAPGRAGWTGWWWGLAHFAVGTRWIAEAFQYQAKMPPEVGWVAVAGLAALLATMPALACALTWRLARTPRARLWLFPAAWMLGEWVRSWLLTGFPWNPLAAALLGEGAPAVASVVGALGVSGLIAFIAALITTMRLRPSARANRERRVNWGVFAPFVVTCVVLAWGSGLPFGFRPDRALVASWPRAELVIVQPDIGQSDKWDPAAAPRQLALLMRLTRSAPPPAPGIARIILWPEVALPQAEIESDQPLRLTLATLLRPGDLLLTGGLAVTRDTNGRPVAAANSLFAIDSAARLVARYDKHHLVPGGEYVPLRPVADALGLSRLAPGDLDFTPGTGPRTLALPGLPAVGPMICYEMIFAGRIVERARRPEWLVNPSNDAWFGDVGPPQHLALARLRAIEEGLAVARATPTGISALIDPRGHLIATLPQHRAGVITAMLPPPRTAPPFARFGHLTSLVLALMFVAAAWGIDRRGT